MIAINSTAIKSECAVTVIRNYSTSCAIIPSCIPHALQQSSTHRLLFPAPLKRTIQYLPSTCGNPSQWSPRPKYRGNPGHCLHDGWSKLQWSWLFPLTGAASHWSVPLDYRWTTTPDPFLVPASLTMILSAPMDGSTCEATETFSLTGQCCRLYSSFLVQSSLVTRS